MVSAASPWWCRGLPYAVVASLVLVGVWTLGMPLRVDENAHFEQIRRSMSGDLTTVPDLTVVKGYHAVVAAVVSITSGRATRRACRLVTMGMAALAVLVFHRAARWVAPGAAGLKTLQFVTSPWILPFMFLIYTDVPSLLLILTSLLLALGGRCRSAGLVGSCSQLIRQNNAVFLALIAGLACWVRHGPPLTAAVLRNWARESWTFMVGLAGFVLFIVVNGGVALGDRLNHPSFSLSAGNVLLLLAGMAVAFLPSLVTNAASVARMAKARPGATALLVLLCCVVTLSFENDHPYNQAAGYHVRNAALALVTATSLRRVGLAVVVSLVVMSLAVTGLRHPVYALLYPFSLLHLASSWLVDPRYVIPPVAFFILLKDESSEGVECAQVWFSLALSIMLMVGIVAGLWFP